MAPHIELSPRTFVVLMLLIVSALAGIFLFLYLPSAKIQVYPAVETRSFEQEITLSTEVADPDFVRFVLPARLVEQEIEDSLSVTRSDTDAHEDYAKGSIVLVNDQEEPQSLLPKTHMRHLDTNIQFLTDKPVRIPSFGRVLVTVTAEEPGSSGNVLPGKFVIDKLSADVHEITYGESSQTFTGGIASDSELTEVEIVAAREELQESLKGRIIGELTLKSGGAGVDPELVQIETISDDSSAEVGSKTVSFEVRQKIKATAFLVDQNDLLSLTLLALRGSSESEEEFIEYDPTSFRASIDKADFGRGEARVIGKLTGVFAQKIEPSVLGARDVIGLGQEEAVEHFEQFPSVGRAEVELSPFWVDSIPSRISGTEIVVKSVSGTP